MLLLLLLKVTMVTSDDCSDALVDKWDNMTVYDPLSSQLTLDMTRHHLKECVEETAFPLYLDVFSVKDEGKECLKHRFQWDESWKLNNWENIVIENGSKKIVIQFISGDFIFRIKKHTLTSKGMKNEQSGAICTGLKKYNNSNGENLIEKIHSKACQDQSSFGTPICQGAVLNLKNFDLPNCFIQTDYTEIDIFLYQVKNNTNCQSIQNWEQFNNKFKANSTHTRKLTNFRDLEFPMKESGNFCFLLSMMETYPRCTSSEAGYQDKCLFSFPKPKPISCGPDLFEPEDIYQNPAIIPVAICLPILICITSLVIWIKKRKPEHSSYRHLLRSLSALSSETNKEEDDSDTNLKPLSRLVLLYFPGELSDKDRNAIVGEVGALRKYGDQRVEFVITDVCLQIEQDMIQDPGQIESDLSSGRTRCLLVLSPGIKLLFDHISGGMDDPLSGWDGAWRSLLPPIARHLVDMRNAGGDMYRNVACIRFDHQHQNLGDQVEINPLKRFSLPSDAEELSLWSQSK